MGPAAELNKMGVYVVRGACSKAACDACLSAVNSSLEEMLALPGKSYDNRHFLRFSSFTGASTNAAAPPPTHQRDFAPSLSPPVDAALRSIIGGLAGDVLSAALGPHAALHELTAITSEPGATEQPLHADACWSAGAPRLVTVFLALHDVLDKSMGPTRFCPFTHSPSCFPGGVWLPPPDAYSRPHPHAAQKLAENPPAWYGLRRGDAVLMDSTSWHGGGGNSSGRNRSILSFSFVEPSAGDGGGGKLRLNDFRDIT